MAKARKIPFLNPNHPVKSCVQKILRVRFDEMISFEEGTIEGKDIEALHDMRVAARRLQAVMKVSLINELNKRGYKEHFYRFIFSLDI